MISNDPGLLMVTIMVICVYSYVFKHTALFTLAERSAIGLAVGSVAAFGVENIIKLSVKPLMAGKIINIIPIVIGALILTNVHRKYVYISRIPIAFLVGSGVSLSMGRTVAANIFAQIEGLFETFPTGASGITILNIILVPFFVICTLLFFTYTKEQTGLLGLLTKIGLYVMMFGFGVQFGNYVMTRTNYVIRPLTQVIYDWLGIVV